MITMRCGTCHSHTTDAYVLPAGGFGDHRLNKLAFYVTWLTAFRPPEATAGPVLTSGAADAAPTRLARCNGNPRPTNALLTQCINAEGNTLLVYVVSCLRE